MRALRRGGALGAVPAQTAWRAGRARRGSRPAVQHLLRSRSLSQAKTFRFLSRKAWLGAVVVLVAAMRQGATAARELTELFGMSAGGSGGAACSRRARSGAWRRPPSCHRSTRPGSASLLERFAGDAAARLVALLRFLLPITGGATMHAA
jgi:hypothetical protein